MAALAVEGKQQSDLLVQLRRFSADHVKISTRDQEWAKGLVDDILKEKVFKLCAERSQLPIRNFEYTGSLYERLKIEAADEVDVMVVLKTGKMEVVAEPAVPAVPGYVRLKVRDSSSLFKKYTNSDGYLLPEKFRSAWFTSLVTTVVTDLKRDPSLAVRLEVRSHGPAIQLDITDKDKLLSCDLVPSFGMGNDYYVAKPYPERASTAAPCDRKLLWRQSFSIREKSKLADMDREDHGCRHELLRIVKTIIRREPTFSKLTTYHLKTAFLRYNFAAHRDWHRDRLADRFREYLGELVAALERKQLPSFWVPQMDLFEGIERITLKNMEERLRRILGNSKYSLTKILQAQASAVPASASARVCQLTTASEPLIIEAGTVKQMSKLTLEAPDTLNQLRKFIAHRNKSSSETAEWTKTVVEKYVRDRLVTACKRKSALINQLEYAGSLYENLKTETPDDDDVTILLVLKAKRDDFTSERRGQHVVCLKAGPGSSYEPYTDTQGYISSVKTTSMFFTLFRATAAEISDLPVKFTVVNRESIIALKIEDSSGKSLLVNLDPAFRIGADYFSASQSGTPDGATIWAKNFALDVKREMQDMDRAEQGCRHDLLRVVKTILRREPTFELLTTHKLKMAFLSYRDSARDWGKEALHTRFLEFLEFLQQKLESGLLAHFWWPEVNLVGGIQPVTLNNMATRLQRIQSSERERNKVLGAPCPIRKAADC